MPAMRGIAERAEIRIVRSRDKNFPAIAQQPVKLLYGANDIGNMLDDMNRVHLIECSVNERIRKLVEIAENIRPCAGNPIDPNRARILIQTAADVENARSLTNADRHLSSVSTVGRARLLIKSRR